MTAAPCPVCGTPITRPRARRYCSRACYAAASQRSRHSPPLWINQQPPPQHPDRQIAAPSVRAAVTASALRPTPAEIRQALARIGREWIR